MPSRAPPRLTSLVGPPGVGKSHQARALAADREALIVPLADAVSEADVLAALAGAVGLHELDADRATLLATLRDRIGGYDVVVLDDADDAHDALVQLIGESDLFADVHAVVTARAPLGVAAERRTVIEPLDREAAVALFLRRAREVYGEAALADRDLAVVERIVSSLDGLPLAIELAVSRLDAVELETMADALDARRLDLVRSGFRDTPKRHASLRAVFESVLAGLGPLERSLLISASVFRGGFTLPALAATASIASPTEHERVDAIARLRRASLVLTGPDRRHRILQVVRDLAREIASEDEIRRAELAHVGHFARLALAHEPSHPQERPRALRVERENLRRALDVALERAPEHAVALARGLHPLLTGGGPRVAHLGMLERALEATRALGDRAGIAQLELRLSEARMGWEGPRDDPRPGLEPVERVLAEIGDEIGVARCKLLRARFESWTSRADESGRLLDEVEAIARRNGDTGLAARVLRHRSRDLLYADRARAESLLHEGLALVADGTADDVRAELWWALALVKLNAGDLAAASGAVRAALAIHAETESTRDEHLLLLVLSFAAWETGRIAEARRLADDAIEHARLGRGPHPEGFCLGYAGLCELAFGDRELALHALPLAVSRMEEAGDPRYAQFFRVWYAAALAASDRAAARAMLSSSAVEVPPGYVRPIARLLDYVNGIDSAPSPSSPPIFEDRVVAAFLARASAAAAAGAQGAASIAPHEGAIEVSTHGYFFSGVGGERVDLRKRPVLRRVLVALARRVPSGAGATIDEIIAEGWPGEKIIPSAAAHRAYMAITTLRRLGLRDHLTSRGGHYQLERAILVDG